MRGVIHSGPIYLTSKVDKDLNSTEKGEYCQTLETKVGKLLKKLDKEYSR